LSPREQLNQVAFDHARVGRVELTNENSPRKSIVTNGFSILKYPAQRRPRFLHRGVHFIFGSVCSKLRNEVDDRNIGSGNPQGYAVEPCPSTRQHETNRLCRASAVGMIDSAAARARRKSLEADRASR